MRGILLRGGGAVPRRCQREAVLCCCRNVFAVRHLFRGGGWVVIGISVGGGGGGGGEVGYDTANVTPGNLD